MNRRLLLILFSLMASCGGAAGRHYNSPFATLFGVITSSAVTPSAEVRVALIWKKKDPEGNIVRSAQDLAVRADFPVRFQLDVQALPPAETLNLRSTGGSLDPNYRYATGTLLVYEDLNHNGALDLLRTDADTSVDRVLGVPERLYIFYVEGSSAVRGGRGAQPGFNLRRDPITVDPQPGAQSCTPTQNGDREYLPLNTEIQIALTAAPELSREMCREQPPAPSPDAGTTPSCPGPTVPAGATVTCSVDRNAFVYKLCTSSGGLCGKTDCEYGCGACLPSDPPPPNWPCH